MDTILGRTALGTILFYFVFPWIPGIQFHGGLLIALAFGLIFAVFAYQICFEAASKIACSEREVGWSLVVMGIGTILLPAILLLTLSNFIPEYLHVSGWGPAIAAAFVALVCEYVFEIL